MPTTAGTLALLGFTPSADSYQVKKLREAGAVIIAKSNLHELASGITTVGSAFGQTLNPYDPARTRAAPAVELEPLSPPATQPSVWALTLVAPSAFLPP